MRRTTQYIVHAPFLALADLVLVQVGLVLAVRLLHVVWTLKQVNTDPYIHLVPMVSGMALATLFFSDLYSGWVQKSKTELAYSVITSCIILAFGTMALSFWERKFGYPRSVILTAMVLQCVLLLAFRLAVRGAHRRAVGPKRGVLIVNDQETGIHLAEQINAKKQDWLRITAVMLARDLVKLYNSSHEWDAVVVAGDVSRKAEIADYCAANRLQVVVVPEFFELCMVGARPLQIDDLLLFKVKPPQLTPGQRLLKRVMDLVGAMVALVLASPAMIVVPIVIRLTSKGPALFKQERVGLHGEEYFVYKFRTMVADAEKRTGPVLATEDDPRITRVGKFLRDTRLDELPQLFNVLKGEMSLVGPRPERAHFVREFCLTLPSYQYRMAVKPGITGLAQVYGRYSTTAAKKLRFDLMYIYDYSFVLDLKILLNTILVVLKREQAAGVAKATSSSEPFFVEQNLVQQEVIAFED